MAPVTTPGPSRRRDLSRRATLLLACSLTGACASPGDLTFHNDRRLRWVDSLQGRKARLPLTLSWAVDGFTVIPPNLTEPQLRPAPAPNVGYFALFVDREPMALGQTIDTTVRIDRSCTEDPACPSEDQLLIDGIYVTDALSVTIGSVPDKSGLRSRGASYTFTIVLMDSSGTRVSDTVWRQTVTVVAA